MKNKPCPFCGCGEIITTSFKVEKSAEKRSSHWVYEDYQTTIQCANCGCSISAETAVKARKKWNCKRFNYGVEQ